MSNKPLQSIKFPGLGDTYTIVDIENFASAYSTSSTYSVGEYVTYDGAFYVCTTAISTAEAWTPAHWEQVTVGEELSDYKAKISHKIDKPETAGTSGQVLTSDGQGGQSWQTPSSPPVSDVQVNGTSVVSQGVANIPIGDADNFGVFKRGTGLDYNSSSGKTSVAYSSSQQAKNGTNATSALNPSHQHESTFYGLAKAASDTTQSASSNPVGTYTDAAKIAIQKMLGIYEPPWELIREDTFTNATEADHTITVDGNGQPFELIGMILYFETPKQETDSAKGNYGSLVAEPASPSYSNRLNTECGAWTQAANANAHGCGMFVENKDCFVMVQSWGNTTTTNAMNIRLRYKAGLTDNNNGIFPNPFYPEPYIITSVKITAVTGTGHYRLYGKRKWS